MIEQWSEVVMGTQGEIQGIGHQRAWEPQTKRGQGGNFNAGLEESVKIFQASRQKYFEEKLENGIYW